jgi:hypothetical protein
VPQVRVVEADLPEEEECEDKQDLAEQDQAPVIAHERGELNSLLVGHPGAGASEQQQRRGDRRLVEVHDLEAGQHPNG